MRNERWYALKQAARKRSGQKCEGCGARLGRSGDCHLHHLTYERFGAELLEDLKILCLACHHQQHPQHTFLPLAEQRRRAKRNAHRKRVQARKERAALPLPEPYVRLEVRLAMMPRKTRKEREHAEAERRAKRLPPPQFDPARKLKV